MIFVNMDKFFYIKKILLKIYHFFNLDPLFRNHFQNVHFCSSVIADLFLDKFSASVCGKTILFGIDPTQYAFLVSKTIHPPFKLLFMGSTWKHKGIHIALSAVKHLYDRGFPVQFHIYGGFVGRQKMLLSRLVKHKRMSDYVVQHGVINHSEMIKQISDYDILIFSSIWNEPYGLVPLEAMAAGVVVVSSGDGGSRDYSFNGDNCLLYSSFSSQDCANKIKKLIEDPELYQRIRTQAHRFIEEKMQLKFTIDQIEDDLIRCLDQYHKKNINKLGFIRDFTVLTNNQGN